MRGAGESFQVDLRGVVDLLSHHLYSSPAVYLRELIQNGYDAITARQASNPSAVGTLRITPADVSTDGRFHLHDNGVGLDESGIRTALATIGASTKRDQFGLARESFLGRFGIGLLSCFLVTDRIEVRTCPVGAIETLVWHGLDDGSWSLEEGEPLGSPGTLVSLTPRGSAKALLDTGSVLRLASRYAAHLPLDIIVETAQGPQQVARKPFPWEERGLMSAASAWAQAQLGFTPLDTIPVADAATGTRGLLFVLPHGSVGQPSSTVFAKRMRVTDSDHELLPAWATFAHGLFDTAGLDLTASREAVRSDDEVTALQERLGQQIRAWLLRLAATDPARAARFLAVHHLGAKAMATTDDALLEILADLMIWDTTVGDMTLADFARDHRVLTYVDSVTAYRQIATVARAQGIPVLNGGYAYDVALIQRYAALHPDLQARLMGPEELATHIEEVGEQEAADYRTLLDLATDVLARSGAVPVVRRFRPESIPALLLIGDGAAKDSDRRHVADEVEGAWAQALQALEAPVAAGPRFVLNCAHPSVAQLARTADPELQRLVVEAWYAQALQSGGHPQTAFDSALAARALTALVDRVVTERTP